MCATIFSRIYDTTNNPSPWWGEVSLPSSKDDEGDMSWVRRSARIPDYFKMMDQCAIVMDFILR